MSFVRVKILAPKISSCGTPARATGKYSGVLQRLQGLTWAFFDISFVARYIHENEREIASFLY